MAVANTNVLNFLGKQVSFEWNRTVPLTDQFSIVFHEKIKGTVTNIVLSVNCDPEISVNEGDFYSLSELINFQIS
ncbi:hypothetical protein [Acinetobacter baumannii]|uniref:hypothetical protein n=1 Tax=Acinetobacter baumannii TaxID=470 RepID=UPI0023404D5E|nr:hypothetical protein [Acinetobacter baumannii]MDC4054324.1 hypothetical protein [Acinetobacter baumannii]MDC4080681.1 hypothetical protein [Acinetobacter baumannii]MDC4140251.1 hypothetical protein [Acinetobacter baumannii]